MDVLYNDAARLPATFAVKDDRLTGHYRTNGEESFGGDTKFAIDITFDAPIEGR